MKEYVKCFMCMSHGFTVMGVNFVATKCSYCNGTGYRTLFTGDYSKEERKDYERILREGNEEKDRFYRENNPFYDMRDNYE